MCALPLALDLGHRLMPRGTLLNEQRCHPNAQQPEVAEQLLWRDAVLDLQNARLSLPCWQEKRKTRAD